MPTIEMHRVTASFYSLCFNKQNFFLKRRRRHDVFIPVKCLRCLCSVCLVTPSALLLLYDITRKSSFDNIRVSVELCSAIWVIICSEAAFALFFKWQHFFFPPLIEGLSSHVISIIFFHLYLHAGLADWNSWVCTEGCGHHVAWQQGKWNFLGRS